MQSVAGEKPRNTQTGERALESEAPPFETNAQQGEHGNRLILGAGSPSHDGEQAAAGQLQASTKQVSDE